MWDTSPTVPGSLQALATEGIDIAGKKLVILGKGGASPRPSACRRRWTGRRRSPFSTGQTLPENAELIRKATGCQAEAYSIADTTTPRQKLEEADLLVNATNVGMGNLQGQCLIPDASYLHHGLFVADIIYNPKKTALLAMAEQAGLPTANGLGMLLYQGAVGVPPVDRAGYAGGCGEADGFLPEIMTTRITHFPGAYTFVSV